ncbi:MAG: hypothetical protein IJ608_14365 [Lachnospiraceae bacterium]|nr:hypothetical protein [Lachnospiraceae bacterium]
MSDDKIREELKAEINEKLAELSVENLEKVSGGSTSVNDITTCPICGAGLTTTDFVSHLMASHPESASNLEALISMIRQFIQNASETEKSIVKG